MLPRHARLRRPRRRARSAGLTAVDEDVPLGDDAIEMVTGEESSASPEETTMDLSDTGLGAEQPVEAYLDEDREASRTGREDRDERAPEPEREAAAEAAGRSRSRSPPRSAAAPSVPSWDEIMFGGGKGD